MDQDADLLGLGQHCSVQHCRQVDFLPFTCDCCSKVFCLEHRQYSAHACPASGFKETEVIVCPLCAKGVRLSPGQDPNIAFEAHSRSGCDPANYNKVHHKKRCPAQGCKEKLTSINTYGCKQCGQRVCLKHRHGDDHGCDAARARNQAQAVQQRAAGSVMGQLKAAIRPASTGAATAAVTRAAAQQQYADPANTLQGTAHRRMQASASAGALHNTPQPQPPQPQPQPQQVQPSGGQTWHNPLVSRSQATPHAPSASAAAAPPPLPPPRMPAIRPAAQVPQRAPPPSSNANPLVSPHMPEECPQCGACFATVERLVQHVEDFHPASASSLAAASGRVPTGSASIPAAGAQPAMSAADSHDVYRCPHCTQQFGDAVQLVGHAERCPQARRSQVQSAAAGDGAGGNCVVS